MDLFDVAAELSKPPPDPFNWEEFINGRKARNRLGQECTFAGLATAPPVGWRKPMYLYKAKPSVINSSTLGKDFLYFLIDERGVWEGNANGWKCAPDLIEMI